MASSPLGAESLRPNTCLPKLKYTHTHTHTQANRLLYFSPQLFCRVPLGFYADTLSASAVPHRRSRETVCQGPGPSGHTNTHIHTNSCLPSLTVSAPSSWHSPVCARRTPGIALSTLQGAPGTQSVRGLFLKDTNTQTHAKVMSLCSQSVRNHNPGGNPCIYTQMYPSAHTHICVLQWCHRTDCLSGAGILEDTHSCCPRPIWSSWRP